MLFRSLLGPLPVEIEGIGGAVYRCAALCLYPGESKFITFQLLCHGRDVLPTRGKSTTGNVVLRFWVLVLGRSLDERLLSF